MIVTIDGRDFQAESGETLLAVARRNAIPIPTLCHHEGLEAWGGCRLCVVDVRRRGAHAARVVPACLFPVQDGLQVETRSERVLRIRAVLLDLLLARTPQSEDIRKLAAEYGVHRTSFTPRVQPDKCILCSICIRACGAVGANALSTAGRGAESAVSLPFRDDASSCVGCGSCALSCPTGNIYLKDEGMTRRIWRRVFERIPCTVCGRPTLTREHAAHLVQRTGLPEDTFTTCDACRREQAGRSFAAFTAKEGSAP